MPNRIVAGEKTEHQREVERKQKARWRRRTGSLEGVGGPGSPRRRWTSEEDLRVRQHSVPDRELALQIGRSVLAIHHRRWRLNGGVDC